MTIKDFWYSTNGINMLRIGNLRKFEYINISYLDNCVGSGSTGVACINTSRNFIGIEKEEKYFNIAVDRIGRWQNGI